MGSVGSGGTGVDRSFSFNAAGHAAAAFRPGAVLPGEPVLAAGSAMGQVPVAATPAEAAWVAAALSSAAAALHAFGADEWAALAAADSTLRAAWAQLDAK